MKLATAAQMREIDKLAIEQYHLPGVVLMENAGAAVAREVERLLGGIKDKKICVFAGLGNNGGDGFVAARYFANGGAKVKVFLIGEKARITGDAQIHADVLSRMGVDVMEITGDRDWDKVRIAVTFSDCLIDALVGTGFHGEMSEPLALIVDIINRSGKRVVAVDVPSGVNADNGQVQGSAVKAHLTVTFGLPKPGLLLYPGASQAGEVVLDGIGLPLPLLATAPVQQMTITAGYVKQLLPKRRADSHKGLNGHVGVIAGSHGYTGAAVLCASGALRAGSGLVSLAVANSLRSIMEAKMTEVMTRTLPELASGAIGLKSIPFVEELSNYWDVIALGPGMGRQNETQAAIREIVRNAEKPLVIDADGIVALAGHMDVIHQADAMAILTPHPGEMAQLTGLSAMQVNQDRIGIARRTANQWGSIIVLKGAPTIVAFPDGEVFVNTSGNAGMATGGTGDVLTGVIAALIAQGLSSHDAAVAGVYLHGLAGDIASQAGAVGLIAGDLLQALPAAIAGLQS